MEILHINKRDARYTVGSVRWEEVGRGSEWVEVGK